MLQDPPLPLTANSTPPPQKKNQFWIRACSENDYEITSGSVSEIYKMDLDAVSTFVQILFAYLSFTRCAFVVSYFLIVSRAPIIMEGQEVGDTW